MRKLLLFGLLAAILGSSLFLEWHLTKAKTIPHGAEGDTLEIVIGGDERAPHPSAAMLPTAPEPHRAAPTAPPGSAPTDRALGAAETLVSVARDTYGSELYAESLAQANGLASPEDAKPGMKVKLPARASLDKRYRVRRGDSLSGIAQKLLGSIKQADRLAAFNHLEDKNALRENQILRIPE
ncbi:MAG: LysM peptidoglycan-binding domain-containing protein [Planctomycetota bacterium]